MGPFHRRRWKSLLPFWGSGLRQDRHLPSRIEVHSMAAKGSGAETSWNATERQMPHSKDRFSELRHRGAILLVVVLATAAGSNLPMPSQQRSAIKAIRETGGHVRMKPPDPNRPMAAFRSANSTSGPIEALEIFDPQRAKTFLWKTGILDRPEALRVLRAPLGDGDLKRLKCFTNLHTLDLFHGEFTNEGLAHLAKLDQLESLTIRGEQIDDSGLRPIWGLPQLRELTLNGTSLSDEGLARMAAMSTLCALGIAGTNITDAGMKHVSRLEGLTELDLNNTAVTDRGLIPLQRLQALSRLMVDLTSVTPAGLRSLKERLPACQITHQSQTDERSDRLADH